MCEGRAYQPLGDGETYCCCGSTTLECVVICWYEPVDEAEEFDEVSEKTEAQSESELPFESWESLGESGPAKEFGIGAMSGLGSWGMF
jgi:hypothetical protein